MKKLRLLLFSKCNRSCEGCCNNDWDLNALKDVKGYKGYSEVILTGGEPMLNPELIVRTCQQIREETAGQPYIQIYMYTAKSKRVLDLIAMLHWLDGVTLTLHEQYDVAGFVKLQSYLETLPDEILWEKSLRLNVFSHVDMTGVDTGIWVVKGNIEWLKDCPLPDDEVFRKLPLAG